MEKSFILGVILLVKSGITGEKVVLSDDFDFKKAYSLAKIHRVIPLLYYGIVNSGIEIEAELNNKYFVETCQSIAVGEKQNFELSCLAKDFEENNIDYMLLKGSVLRSLYPKSELRSMGDADILIHYEQYKEIMPLLQKNGMTFVKENLNEICWDKHPFYLELHRYLVSPKHKDYYKYYGDGWKFAKLEQGYKHKYAMSDEDFFVFLFAHFTKHYRSSGIGIKHITDIWVYLNKKPNLDIGYVKQELEKLGMLVFYENIIKTVDAWFAGKEFDDITYLITEKIFASGAFGTAESGRVSEALKDIKGNDVKNIRLNRTLSVVFLPYSNMSLLFPVLKKIPVLLPFLWLYRGIHTMFFKKGTIARHFNTIKQLTPEQISRYEKELNAVGLDYNFEE